MTVFYLVRHAAHATQGERLVGRVPGARLGELGRRQLRFLRERLAGLPIEAVHSGPLERAEETARALGLPVTIAPELDELDYGDWTGCSVEELAGDLAWEAWNRFRTGTRIPGGETMLQVQARSVGLVQRLQAEHPSGRVVLVSHGDVIRAVLLHYLGLSLDLFARVEINPGSLSVLAVEPWGARVLLLNQTADPAWGHADQPSAREPP
jgi:broad specificity phosphatase PhoE